MKLSARFILLLCALVCFICATLGVPSRVAWKPLGLAFLTAAFMV